ncbi:glycosyltransferase family 2 protein [Homoserinimonas sp. A447]
MSSLEKNGDTFSLSVVIPAYNSAEWLPTTLDSLAKALQRTSWTAEVVVVDDGSTDDTVAVLSSLQKSFPYPIRIVEQRNQGVFLAVWEGLKKANFEQLLILNSRLILREDALEFVEAAQATDPTREAWNGHVATDPSAPLVGRFWEVPTHLFWGSYLANPRTTLITSENFDMVPKGTGCFLVQKDLFRRAYEVSWPDTNARFTSDDTKLLRFVAAHSPIRLEPSFFATYRPRTTFRKFLAHARGRGTMFVDSYAGTSAARNVVLLLLGILPPIFLIALIALAAAGQWAGFWVVAAVGVAALVAPAIVAAARRCPPRACLSYLCFVVPFGVAFWTGLVRGLVVHRKSFARRDGQKEELAN